jgi:hypothetical protein
MINDQMTKDSNDSQMTSNHLAFGHLSYLRNDKYQIIEHHLTK